MIGSSLDRASRLVESVHMNTSYNVIAGQSVERLAELGNGIFAVAVTLLVLDLRVAAIERVHSERRAGHMGAIVES
jgi:hypothetical protein